MSLRPSEALNRNVESFSQDHHSFPSRQICHAFQTGQCLRDPCPYRHVLQTPSHSTPWATGKSNDVGTPQSTSGGSPTTPDRSHVAREPVILDIAEIMRGCKIAIRHVSEGPPPKTQASPERATAPGRVKREENSNCVFVIRGVSKLGDEAGSLIRAFFARFGTISSLRFAAPGRQGQDRDFAPSVAFVVMSSAAEVSAVLVNDSYVIGGRRVQVEEYNRTVIPSAEDDAFDDMASSLLKSLDL